MNKKLAFLGAAAVTTLSPLLAFAQSFQRACTGVINSGAEDIICRIYRIINIAIPVLILGAVAYFIWGIVNFITAKDGESKEESRGMMVHGIIGFAVILGLWGLVNILLSTFGLSGSNAAGPQPFPTF
jgi:hypothetical protein